MLLDINSLFYSWIRGGILLLLLYHFVFYIKHKEDIYKYFSIYLLGILIFMIKDIFKSDIMLEVYEYLMFSIQFLVFSYYIHFTRILLDTQKEYPEWDKKANVVAKLILLLGFSLVVIQFFFGFEGQKKVLIYAAPLLSVFFVYELFNLKIILTKEGTYSLIGSLMFLFGANITAIKIITGDSFLEGIKVHNMFYFFTGALIQITIYAFLLADVLKKIEAEKSNVELNLVKKSSQLYELKMTAFKNQMNPHFLFNSLNSINNFVIQNKKEEASDYITKFSSLIRKVLQTTEKVSISLEEELKIAELYIRIELARLRNSFSYEINVDESINKSKLKVVPLFLQPFLENAIWHGLNSYKGEKKLVINILDEKEYIKAEVIDNGIGIKESINRKKVQKIKRKPFGIKTVKNRLDLIYKPENVSIEIGENLLESKENGTVVTIVFPKNKEI